MFGDSVRVQRLHAGLTQAQLADLSGISRQMLSAIEAGRHLPRIDAGLAIAEALGTTVEALLTRDGEPVTLDDATLADGPVRVARVGARMVAVPTGLTEQGWTPADAIVRDGHIELLAGGRPGILVLGCDPVLGLLGRGSDRFSEWPVVAVPGSSGRAIAGLAAGRLHAGVVHGPAGALPTPPVPVRRVHLASWEVGLAAMDATVSTWADALAGRRPVVQRDPGAGSQQAFERAVHAAGGTLPPGPLAGGHHDAARRAVEQGQVALTIRPVALAMGLSFHPLETHVAELWINADDDVPAQRLMEQIMSSPVQRQLAAIGGYDLTDVGTAVTA